MAEKFSFFDPILNDVGQRDREYNAQEFTDYFASLVTTGVMKASAVEPLKVSADVGTAMGVLVGGGVAFVEGRYYQNTGNAMLGLDTEQVGFDRIDRIVVRLDLNTDSRFVRAFVVKGIPSASPVPPALTRTSMIYEISLAQVRVVGGQTFIVAGNITDERGTPDICPWAGSNILPNFDDSSLADLVSTVQTHVINMNNPHNTDSKQINVVPKIDLSTSAASLKPGITISGADPNAPAGLGSSGVVATIRDTDSGFGAMQIVSPNAVSDDRILMRKWNPSTGTWSMLKELGGGGIDDRLETINYYVAPGGNDANDGLSPGTAFASFHKAITMIKKINFGRRIINCSAGIVMTGVGGIDYRNYELSGYIGGALELNMGGNVYSPLFRNCTANILVQNFIRFDAVAGSSCGFTNCFGQAEVVGMNVNRTGMSSPYAAIEFQNVGWGRVASSSFVNIGSEGIIRTNLQSYVYTWGISGNMKETSNIPFHAAQGSILEIIGNTVTGYAVRDQTSEGGQIFGL